MRPDEISQPKYLEVVEVQQARCIPLGPYERLGSAFPESISRTLR